MRYTVSCARLYPFEVIVDADTERAAIVAAYGARYASLTFAGVRRDRGGARQYGSRWSTDFGPVEFFVTS